MVAVNAWDEERDVVAKFVEDNDLKQKVLLMGAKVAAELYGVTSYPASFLIDKKGVVVKHEVGFSAEMAGKLEEDIVGLLAKQK